MAPDLQQCAPLAMLRFMCDRHRHVSLLLGLLVVFTSGCQTPFVAEILPMETRSILDETTGFLLVEIDSNTPLHRLRIESVENIDSHFYIEDYKKGRRTLLMRLSAGEYRWRQIEIYGYQFRSKTYPYIWKVDTEQEHWRFKVEAGKVNYPGVLVLSRDDKWLTYFTLNRSGEMAERLLEFADWLLRDYPVIYTGRRRDDFLEFYSAKIAAQTVTPDLAGEDDTTLP